LLAASQNTTLCLDEPENFLALREVQPWLDALMSRTETNESQAVLVSHHPELINALAVGHGRWLDRTSGGPTRCQPITEDGSGLPISELVARGWLNA
jgi:predicted ATPase